MSAIGDGRDHAWGVVGWLGSGATHMADQVIASRGKPVEEPTGVRVEVDGVFRDERVDRMEKGEEPVTITRLGRRDARHLIPGGMWRDFEKFRSACPVRCNS